MYGAFAGKDPAFYPAADLSGILQLLFNAADVVVVGRYAGNESLAAVGSTGSLTNLLVNVFIGLSVGVNVLVARYYGGKKERRGKRYGAYRHDRQRCGRRFPDGPRFAAAKRFLSLWTLRKT